MPAFSISGSRSTDRGNTRLFQLYYIWLRYVVAIIILQTILSDYIHWHCESKEFRQTYHIIALIPMSVNCNLAWKALGQPRERS